MYLWKSWHDSRHRLMVYAGACLALGVVAGIEHIFYYHLSLEWQQALSNSPRFKLWRWDFVRYAWGRALFMLWRLMPTAALWSALALGATSVGREYGSGAISFVLTRPQSRSRIVWEEWVLAIAEIWIILAMFYVGVLPFLIYTSGHNVMPSATPVLGVLAVAACVCGLTQFLTMLTGSSTKGLSAAIAACLIYNMLPDALDVWWRIRWPAEVRDLSLTVLGRIGQAHLPMREIALIWAMVALIFPLLSQWLIEKREV